VKNKRSEIMPEVYRSLDKTKSWKKDPYMKNILSLYKKEFHISHLIKKKARMAS